MFFSKSSKLLSAYINHCARAAMVNVCVEDDGVVTVKETLLPGVPVQTVPVIHTFIMNSRVVAQDIVKIANSPAVMNS